MTAYANRICTNCGIRKPQPHMYQKEIYVETGKSQTGISGATLAGVFLAGDKKSGKQFRDWMFNNNQRTYKRKKKVWLCGICSGNERPVVQAPPKKVVKKDAPVATDTSTDVVTTEAPASKSNLKWWLLGIVILGLAASFEDDKKKKVTQSPTTNSQSSP